MPKANFFKKYFLNIIVGFSNLVLILAVIFAVRAIIKNSQDFFSLRQILFSLEKQEQGFSDLTRNYQENSEEMAVIENSFSELGAPVEFLGFLEETAKNTGLAIKTELYANPKAKTDVWNSVLIQIGFRGKSDNAIRFLEKIENNIYMAEVIEFTAKRLVAAGKDGSGGSAAGYDKDLIEGSFSIKVYAK